MLSFQGITLDIPEQDCVKIAMKDGKLTLHFSDYTGSVTLHRDEDVDIASNQLSSETPSDILEESRLEEEARGGRKRVRLAGASDSSLPAVVQGSISAHVVQASPKKVSKKSAAAVASSMHPPMAGPVTGTQPTTSKSDSGKRLAQGVLPFFSSLTSQNMETEDENAVKSESSNSGSGACVTLDTWASRSHVSVQTLGSAPKPRWGHRATLITPTKMLITGGDAAEEQTLDDMHVLDLETGTWEPTCGSAKVSRSFHTATFIESQNLCVVFGGENNSKQSSKVLSDLMILDVDYMVWFEGHVNGKAPSARTGHTCVLSTQNQCVVFGGCKGSKFFNDTFVLDTTSWNWFQPALSGTPPPPRAYHGAAMCGDKMIVIMGDDSNKTFGDVYALDTETWCWEQHSPTGVAVQPRTGHVCVALGNRNVLVYGGWNNDDDADDRFNDAFVLNTETWTWVAVQLVAGDAVPARVGAAAVALTEDVGSYPADTVVLFGGMDKNDKLSQSTAIIVPQTSVSNLSHGRSVPDPAESEPQSALTRRAARAAGRADTEMDETPPLAQLMP